MKSFHENYILFFGADFGICLFELNSTYFDKLQILNPSVEITFQLAEFLNDDYAQTLRDRIYEQNYTEKIISIDTECNAYSMAKLLKFISMKLMNDDQAGDFGSTLSDKIKSKCQKYYKDVSEAFDA